MTTTDLVEWLNSLPRKASNLHRGFESQKLVSLLLFVAETDFLLFFLCVCCCFWFVFFFVFCFFFFFLFFFVWLVGCFFFFFLFCFVVFFSLESFVYMTHVNAPNLFHSTPRPSSLHIGTAKMRGK